MHQFKPGQLVQVKADGYQYTGQIMSTEVSAIDESEESHYMVHRVPGHPGTLAPIATNRLSLSRFDRIKNVFVHYAVITGRGSFPVDMLRYDSAAPVNFKLVEDNRNYLSPMLDLSDYWNGKLVIATVSDRQHPNWTKARWSSFLWGISELKTELMGDDY